MYNANKIIEENRPLAVRVRPRTLEEFAGQTHILGEGKFLRRAIISKKVSSLIFYGPSGCGKTTLGLIIANHISADFQYLNAAFSSTQEVKNLLITAKENLHKEGRRTIFFIDEIHRFNKLQQEILVPDTETGSIIFIGATIYNPYYYLIPSLISRSVVAQFKPLTSEDIICILKRAIINKENGLGNLDINVSQDALEYVVTMAGGDARKALTGLEIGVLSMQPDKSGQVTFNLAAAQESIQKNIFYDKKGTYHYDTISAFIKSIRGSDVDSALYWLAKMLVSGEDPRFIARRLVILASEDIGNAEPFALVLAANCFNAVESVGMPEGKLILAQTTIYLACSPKSNSAYRAISSALEDVEKEETQEVPSNVKTHSKSYKYPHNYPKDDKGGYVKQDYGARKKYYFPLAVGEEKKLKYFLDNIEKLKNADIRKSNAD